jgi:hypothetical protein
MRIAIDLNDVIRDFSNNFLKYYLDLYNHEFDLSDFEFFSKDLKLVFPFQNDDSYYRFMYEDNAFELFAKCPTCSSSTDSDLKKFISKAKEDYDIDIIFVSTKEYGLSMGATYFFISKLNPSIREVFLPFDSTEIWDRCDALITADPNLIGSKPDDKTSILIDFDYNKGVAADYKFNSFKRLVDDGTIFDKLLSQKENNQ